MSGQRPPPPPPPPGYRPGGMAPPPHPDSLPRGPPGPGQYPQPMPHMQIPIRNSTRVRNVSRKGPLDENGCRKKLTTYRAYTIRKVIPDSPSQKPTWAMAYVTEEAWGQEDIIKQLNRLNSKDISVTEKKEALKPNMQMQVNELLDELYNEDRWDPNFETSLAQLDSKTHTLKTGVKETATLTVYAKRAPKPDIPVIALYEARQMQKLEQMRPQGPPPPAGGQGPDMGGGMGGPGFVDLGSKGKDKNKKGKGKGAAGKVPAKKKSYTSSTSSDFTGSESDSGSEYTTTASSWSSESGRRQKKYNQGGRRRSHDRIREHQRFVNAPMPPDSGMRAYFGGGPRPSYIPPIPPEVPFVAPTPDIDNEVAYHQGKLDADRERFEIERKIERARIRAIEEAPQTTMAFGGRLERDNIGPRRLGPRLVPDTRYTDELRRQDELRRDELRREEDIRRDELRREDLRREDLRQEETRRRESLRQRELDHDEYTGRRRSSTPRIYNADPNPFTERRRSPPGYSPSLGSSGW